MIHPVWDELRFGELPLVWDEWNRPHVEKHGCSRDEVDFFWTQNPVGYKESYKKRILLLGPGFDGRLLGVVVGPVPGLPSGNYYTFSARPATRKEQADYETIR